MDGILNINKPRGMTSFQVVAAVRRAAGMRKVGHGGTLDPDADGVLPVCLGQATRVSQYLLEGGKTYLAEIEFGISTDTYDLSGQVTARADAGAVTNERIEAACSGFRGVIAQTPPMYSALKHRGQPLYKLARRGITVARPAREVSIYRLEIKRWQPPRLTLEIDCGRGTYIRALAHDLGERLGCGAVLAGLSRLRCGPFRLADALAPDEIAAAGHKGQLHGLLHPADSVLKDWPSLTLNEAQATAFGYGQLIPIAEITGMPPGLDVGAAVRVYDDGVVFLGTGRLEGETEYLKPLKVFRPSQPRPIG